MSKLYGVNTSFNGVVYIGDAHNASKAWWPGRNLGNYTERVNEKISFIADFCRENNLLPVFLGDLFVNAKDTESIMMSSYMVALKKFHVTPLCWVGNHDCHDTSFTLDTGLGLLALSGLLNVVDKPGIVDVIQVNDQRVAFGGTPFGSTPATTNEQGEKGASKPFEIPAKTVVGQIAEWCEANQAEKPDLTVWVTHHDLDFTGKNVFIKDKVHEISGCDMWINGHQHDCKEPLQQGMTLCVNPGNITLGTIAEAMQNTPGFLVQRPEAGKAVVETLERKALPLEEPRTIFDFTGKHADKIGYEEGVLLTGQSGARQTAHISAAIKESHFVESLLASGNETEMDAIASASPDVLKSTLQGIFVKLGTPEVAQKILMDLVDREMSPKGGRSEGADSQESGPVFA